MTAAERETQEACAELYKLLCPDEDVLCVLRHRSRSGMMRVIDLFVIRKGGLRRISWSAAKALGWTYNRKHDGITADGCGMDMGFHLVYSLAQAVYGDTRKHKAWARKQSEHGTRSAGYMLRSRWV